MRVAKPIFLVLVILSVSFDIRAEEERIPVPVSPESFDEESFEEEFKKFKEREEEKIIRLRRARSLKCTYERASIARWEGGRLKLELIDADMPPTHLDAIDLYTRTARKIGNVGAADVAVLPSLSGISFFEVTPSGNFVFTTVFAEYNADGDFIVVTARHMVINGKPMVSQYHGTCKVWE